MKKLLTLIFTIFSLSAFSQSWTAAIPHQMVISGAPSASGARLRFDLDKGRIYEWNPTTVSWNVLGQGIDKISGGIPPAYTPDYQQSAFAINDSSELYHYINSAWRCLNCSTGATYTAGTGINIDGSNVISNTGDLSATNELITDFGVSAGSLVVTDAGGAHNVVVTDIAPIQSGLAAEFNQTGSVLSLDYTNAQKATALVPGFLTAADWTTFNNKLSVEVDGSITNEIQTLSFANPNLSISGGNTVDLSGLTPTQLWTDGTQEIYPTDITDFVSIGTTTADRLFHVEASDAVTNAVTYPQRLTHITSGTATAGFGCAWPEIEMENGSGTNRIAATQEITWSDAVDATEDATWGLDLIRAGTLTRAITVSSTGNMGIGITSPTARVNIKGSGPTSATTSFLVENSAGTDAFSVDDAAGVRVNLGGFFRFGAASNSPFIYPGVIGSPDYASGTAIIFDFPNSTYTAGTGAITFKGNHSTSASGTSAGFRSYFRFGPSSGSHAFTNFLIDGEVAQTGTSSGNIIGLDYNPTLTSILGAHYAMLIRSGRVGIGTATPSASALVDITSTTSGFLPPRMTTAQRDAIASPATGLIIFCTDCTATDASTGVSQTYSSSAWRNHY